MSAAVFEESITDIEKERLATSIIEVSKLTRALLAMHLATIALSPGEDDYMLALNPRGPTDLGEAAEELDVHLTALAASYDRLRVRNLVEVQGNVITLTKSGSATRSCISTIYRMVGEDIADRLSVNRLEVVKKAFDDVQKNMKRALQKAR